MYTKEQMLDFLEHVGWEFDCSECTINCNDNPCIIIQIRELINETSGC